MKAGAIVVTGTSRGIGAGIANELVRRGFEVGCLSRSGGLPEGSEALPKEVLERFIPAACDVNDELVFSQALRTVADKAGGIRGLVNNAGIHSECRSEALKTSEFERIIGTNTTAVFMACREVYPYLRTSEHGIIVNIGSFFDRLGVKGSTAYCASKAAVAAITRCLATEWGSQGISVVNIAPGYIETDVNREYLNNPQSGKYVRSRIPIRRPGEVSEVARLIGAIFVEDIPFMTGHTIYIDGGQSINL